MAVYTKVSEQDLKNHLTQYDLGELVSYEGIEAGVSNTNYFVTTTSARFVLTLFEPHRVNADDISSYVEYSTVLEQNGVPCPKTMQTKTGQFIVTLCNRPSAFFCVLDGECGSVGMLSPNLCEEGGVALAKMHMAAAHINTRTKNHFGLKKWQEWSQSIGDKMNAIDGGLYDLVCDEMEFIMSKWPKNLPSGQIHGDYFADNVFFQNEKVTGVIDFHFVCYDMFAYDLAIGINAWAFDKANNFDENRMAAMMRGYQSIRPLDAGEEESFSILLRGASMRFLLSRIEEKLAHSPGNLMIPHDPMVFEKRLKHFQNYVIPA